MAIGTHQLALGNFSHDRGQPASIPVGDNESFLGSWKMIKVQAIRRVRKAAVSADLAFLIL